MADETVQEMPDPMQAEPGAPVALAPEPVVEPVAEVVAPDIADETAPDPASEIIDQPTSAPAIDTDGPLFSRFRKLWHGGERRAAVEWAKAMEVAENEWDALMGEFPELLNIINGS